MQTFRPKRLLLFLSSLLLATSAWGQCPISSFPYMEDFDALSPNNSSIFTCITSDNLTGCWINDSGNTNNWTARSSGTSSSSTGPSAERASGGGNYVFLEASSCQNTTSVMTGPDFDISSLTTPRIRFWYHMFGSDMGTLSLEASTDGGANWSSIWTLSGDQGNQWFEATVNLSSFSGASSVIFRFVGVTGIDVESDMAVDDFTLEETPTCLDPSLLSNTVVDVTTADFSWMASPSSPVSYDWIVVTLGTGTMATPVSSGSATGTSTTVAGLSPQTDYDFYVRANCGGGDEGIWIGPVNFTTDCDVFPLPFVESFDASASIPDCWEQDSGNAEDWEFDSSSDHGAASDHTSGSGRFAYVDDSGPNTSPASLVTPALDLTGIVDPRLVFWFQNRQSSTSGDASELYIDVFDGSVWNNGVFSITTDIFAWTEYIVDLTAYSSAMTQIRFRVIEGSSGFNSDACIDDITVEKTPTCFPPETTTSSTITTTTVDFSWTASPSGTASYDWIVVLSGAGETGTPETSGSISATVVTVTGLTPGTSYDFYVRSDCGLGDESLWADPISFSTLCASVDTFPYRHNFDDLTPRTGSISGCQTADDITECWENEPNNSNMWIPRTGATTSSDTGPSADHTTGSANYIYIEASSCSNNTSVLYTPTFDVTNLAAPRLSFWYHMFGGDMGTLSVEASTDAGLTWSASLWSLSGDQGDNWLEATVDLSAYAGNSSLLLRFSGITGSSFESDIAIDDVTLEETPPEVSVAVSPAQAQEDNATFVYTFTASHPSTTDLLVSFSVGGDAVFNTDYTVTGATNFSVSDGTITIPANQTTAQLTVTVQADSDVESDETIIITITSAP